MTSPISVPEDLCSLQTEDLELFLDCLVSFKKKRRQEIEQAETILVGIKEELRKRKEKGLLAQTFQNAFMKESGK
jgi:hypothetical protein